MTESAVQSLPLPQYLKIAGLSRENVIYKTDEALDKVATD
jgi:hypothetical protein